MVLKRYEYIIHNNKRFYIGGITLKENVDIKPIEKELGIRLKLVDTFEY